MRKIKDNDKTSRNIKSAYENGKYIVTYRSVYQPFYSVSAGYYALKVYYQDRSFLPLTLWGRFCHKTGDEVNRLIKQDLLDNLPPNETPGLLNYRRNGRV